MFRRIKFKEQFEDMGLVNLNDETDYTQIRGLEYKAYIVNERGQTIGDTKLVDVLILTDDKKYLPALVTGVMEDTFLYLDDEKSISAVDSEEEVITKSENDALQIIIDHNKWMRQVIDKMIDKN